MDSLRMAARLVTVIRAVQRDSSATRTVSVRVTTMLRDADAIDARRINSIAIRAALIVHTAIIWCRMR